VPGTARDNLRWRSSSGQSASPSLVSTWPVVAIEGSYGKPVPHIPGGYSYITGATKDTSAQSPLQLFAVSKEAEYTG
jgi:hypothetical protein